ncbi:hypothetical protein D3C85_1447430 [compost metagenome]
MQPNNPLQLLLIEIADELLRFPFYYGSAREFDFSLGGQYILQNKARPGLQIALQLGERDRRDDFHSPIPIIHHAN